MRSHEWLPSRGPIKSETRSPRLDGDILDRADRHLFRTLRDAGGKRLPDRPAPQLERPGDAVTALRVRVLHAALRHAAPR